MKLAPWWLAWLLRRLNKVAITLPPFGIYALPGVDADPRLARHEQVHWAQYKRMGLVRFYATYLWQVARFGYRDAPMEVEARKVAGR